MVLTAFILVQTWRLLAKLFGPWVSTEFDFATKPKHNLVRGNPRRSFERQVKTFFLGFMAQHAESAGLAATRPLSPNWCAE